MQKCRRAALLTVTQPVDPGSNRSRRLIRTWTVEEKLKARGSKCKEKDLKESIFNWREGSLVILERVGFFCKTAAVDRYVGLLTGTGLDLSR
jgi:hypothetical protein